MMLTEATGPASCNIYCVDDESGTPIFATPIVRIEFGNDPLQVVGVPFEIGHAPFPKPGVYNVQFVYNGQVVEEQPLLLR